MLRICWLLCFSLILTTIIAIPGRADPWGAVSARFGSADTQGPGGGIAAGAEGDLLFNLGRKFQTGIQLGAYGGSTQGRVWQGSWQWRLRKPTGAARPYATLGTGIYSAPEVLPAPGPDAGAARVVTSSNLGINYGFGVEFPLGARSLLGIDFRVHSFGREPYNPRDMFNVTLGLGMNLGG